MRAPAAGAIDPADPVGPPRSNGELTFDAPWQGRAFAICLAVLEREGLAWADFRDFLVAEIARAPGADYYDAFAVALEALLIDRGLVDAATRWGGGSAAPGEGAGSSGK